MSALPPKADIHRARPDVRFVPKSGHADRLWILLLVGKGAQVRGASPVKLPRRRFLHLASGAAALPAMTCVASALDYPMRPVRIVVGFVAGQNLDITARLIGQWLSERLGQQFVTENRPGAGGNVGAEVQHLMAIPCSRSAPTT